MYYYVYIRKERNQNIIIKLGDKDIDKTLSLVSFNHFEMKDGLYIVETKPIDGIEDVIPVIPVFFIMEDSKFDLHIFGDEYYKEGLYFENDGYEWTDYFLQCCESVINAIQKEELYTSAHTRRMELLHPEYADGETATKEILTGKITFSDIARELFTPVLPDPSRSVLVPWGSGRLIHGSLRLTDINSFETTLRDCLVFISTQEDIDKWKGCFSDFFTIIMEEDHPKFVFDSSKGKYIRKQYVGNGKEEKEVEFKYTDEKGREGRFIARIPE